MQKEEKLHSGEHHDDPGDHHGTEKEGYHAEGIPPIDTSHIKSVQKLFNCMYLPKKRGVCCHKHSGEHYFFQTVVYTVHCTHVGLHVFFSKVRTCMNSLARELS